MAARFDGFAALCRQVSHLAQRRGDHPQGVGDVADVTFDEAAGRRGVGRHSIGQNPGPADQLVEPSQAAAPMGRCPIVRPVWCRCASSHRSIACRLFIASPGLAPSRQCATPRIATAMNAGLTCVVEFGMVAVAS
ncbi:hypothetical protein [Mycolicibacterium doricum]|uniref:Uncharacterized protein n=1 Tax=Mycolicibacterium doricum TaxID=126673 RepID=A0A1X1TK65_9MYCO|nr:hypothetical protein [Mycolicibacterium doricum]MCV7268615.1 hypothetical protein [Mycolicibacterium doricum]ORV44869.1 hypothetical protein AWC01_02070 [Mycolicibacterium doricum]